MQVVSLSNMWAQGRFQRLAEFAAAAQRQGWGRFLGVVESFIGAFTDGAISDLPPSRR